MSTKIWTAWRIPLSRFTEATDILHEELSKEFYSFWSRRLNAAYETELKKGEIKDLYEFVIAFDRKMHELQSQHPYESYFDFNYGFRFFLDKRYAYVIPYGVASVPVPEWFEDFHYQDQVDRDESIPLRQWNARKRKWDELWIRNPKNREYTHAVVDSSGGFYVATADYSRRWLDEQMANQPEVTQ